MEQCSICLEGLDNGVTLACGHRFHANGPLVPRVRKTSKKRDREEPAAPPPRKRVSAPPADHLLGYLDLAPLLRGDACLDAVAQP